MSRQGLLQINKDDIPANNVECINRKIKEHEAEIAALKKKLKTCRDTAVLDEQEVGVKIGNVLFLDLCDMMNNCNIDIDSEFDIATPGESTPYFRMEAARSISQISDDATIDKAIKHIEYWYTQYGKIYKFLKDQKATGVKYILEKPDDEELDKFEFD
jgi:hypothetical protein